METIEHKREVAALDQTVAAVDLVRDCFDNFATRHDVNRACVKYGKPLVSGAAIRFAGQVSVFDLRRDDAPCYHCLFPEADNVDELRCAITRDFGPLVAMVGSMHAAESTRMIAGWDETRVGRIH